MTSIFDALTQLFTRWGIGLRYIQWCVAGVLAGYVGLAVLSVFLSSWGFQWLIWIFVAFYMFGVINLMASPFLWGGVAGAAYVRGQAGGQEGLSVEDGINTVKDWGGKAIQGTAKFLLFYGAIPFIWTALFQTKGWEQENLVALILLPTVIYFALVRWPNSQSVFNAIGYVLIAVVLVGVLGTIYGTAQNKTTDPAVALMQEYQETLSRDDQKEDADLISDLIDKVKNKGVDSLGIEERKFWDQVEAEATRTDSLKKRAETFVLEAKPTNAGWWQAHWHYFAGILAIAVALYWFFGRRTRTAGATPAGAHGSTGSTERAPNRLRGWIYLGIIAWCGYSIFTETGWPGTWVAEGGYQKTKMVMIGSEAHGYRTVPQQLCGLMPDADLKFSSPKAQYDEGARRQQPYRTRATFYTREANGSVNPMSIANILVNDTRMGEKIHTDKNGCVTVSVYGPVATMLGGPVWNGNGWTDRNSQSPPQSIAVELRFYGWGVDDVNFSGY